jgi:hypothetical protein
MATHCGFIPDEIIAGETIWLSASNSTQSAEDITFADYTPAGGYTLAYDFAAPTPITVAATANGDNTGWSLEVTAAQTLLWKSGQLSFSGCVTHTATGRKFAVDAGYITVQASPLSTSQWSAIVAACDAAMVECAASGYASFSVAGMNVTFKSTSDIIALRDYARTMERQETGNRFRRIIRSRFQCA